jgi:hypothetical protein
MFLRTARFLAPVLAIVPSASAALSASASISTSQVSAPFNYTVTLHNTGDTAIGSFWFAWTDVPRSYDFLPTTPSNITAPAGWVFPVTHNTFPGDGYGIEWYNVGGSSIGPGGVGTFQFTSNDSPTALAGPAFFPGFQILNSVVYIGFPQGDPGYTFTASIPGPGGAATLALCGLSLMRRRRSGSSR